MGVQRGSPPQADAEDLVVDSPQDEGCPQVRNPLESPFGKGGFKGDLGTKGVEIGHGQRAQHNYILKGERRSEAAGIRNQG